VKKKYIHGCFSADYVAREHRWLCLWLYLIAKIKNMYSGRVLIFLLYSMRVMIAWSITRNGEFAVFLEIQALDSRSVIESASYARALRVTLETGRASRARHARGKIALNRVRAVSSET